MPAPVEAPAYKPANQHILRYGRIFASVTPSEDTAVKRAWLWCARRVRVEGPLRYHNGLRVHLFRTADLPWPLRG